MKYVAPKSGLEAFTCPHSGVFAKQHHFALTGETNRGVYAEFGRNPIRISKCEHCGENCIWHHHDMVSPSRGEAPQPNPEMPEGIKRDYEEAASIYGRSPRGAAALLRLAIQKLCAHLGAEGKNINKDIGFLVKKGLPPSVQQALDVVRVTGNNAMHPGQIETDDIQVAESLFL